MSGCHKVMFVEILHTLIHYPSVLYWSFSKFRRLNNILETYISWSFWWKSIHNHRMRGFPHFRSLARYLIFLKASSLKIFSKSYHVRVTARDIVYIFRAYLLKLPFWWKTGTLIFNGSINFSFFIVNPPLIILTRFNLSNTELLDLLFIKTQWVEIFRL